MGVQATVKVGVRGNAIAVTLPKDILVASGIDKGDMVRVTADADGVRLTRIDDAYAQAMAAGQECFDRYPETLAALAK